MEAYVTVITSVVTAILTYMIARGKLTYARDVFYEGKISEFMTVQERKINDLQNEVARLTSINLELLEKVIHLETELSKYDTNLARSFTK